MKKKFSILLSGTLIFTTCIQFTPAFAASYDIPVNYIVSSSEKVLKTGVTEEGIPYTVSEIKTTFINPESRATMEVDVVRHVTYHFDTEQQAKSFRPPKTQYWSEDLGGNGNFTGTLRLTATTWSRNEPTKGGYINWKIINECFIKT